MILSFSNTFFCAAEDLTWTYDKEEAFRLAKEQDKYVLLFVGNPGCGICNGIIANFTNEQPLRQIIDKEYILWYFDHYNNNNNAEKMKLISMYTTIFLGNGVAKYYPLIYLINPYDPDNSVKSNWGNPNGHASHNKAPYSLIDFISIKQSLNEGLTWHDNKEDAISKAKQEGKKIFKLVGRGTSGNTKRVIKHLNEDVLKQIIDKNYILLYSDNDAPVAEPELKLYSGESAEIAETTPYMYIIDPDEPEKNIVSEWGYKGVAELKEMLENAVVSNEIFERADNIITLTNNMLYISNNIFNEHINIYTINGQQIYSISKKERSITIDASGLPKDVLIIHSSNGWSYKVLNR